MSYLLVIEGKAKKELSKVPREYQQRIRLVLRSVASNPFEGKKLEGELKGKYSIRVWPYRIIYEIYEKHLIVSVIHIGHRKDVYRKF